MAFHQMLKKERLKRALSQQELAEKIGTTPPNVSRWERGLTFPTPYYRQKLCKFFDIEPQVLFQEINTSHPPSKGNNTFPSSSPSFDDDIFQYNMTLPDADEFFGRRRERNLLLARVKTGQPTSITGPRRIGKTWLMKYLHLTVPQQLGPHIRIAYLDASQPSCSTVPNFLEVVLRELNITTPIEKTEQSYLQALEMGVRELRANDLIPILCIDKFEWLGKLPDINPDLIDRLRALTQQGFGMVTTSKYSLDKVVRAMFGENNTISPLSNVFLQLPLKPFTEAEAQEFVQSKGKQAEDLLPRRLQLVGTLLHNDKMLALQGHSYFYRPHDSNYWAEFEKVVAEELQEAE